MYYDTKLKENVDNPQKTHLNWVFFHLVAKSPGLYLSLSPKSKMKCQIIAQYQY